MTNRVDTDIKSVVTDRRRNSNFVDGYWLALDDIYDSLDKYNPCHDEVRKTISRLRKWAIGVDE